MVTSRQRNSFVPISINKKQHYCERASFFGFRLQKQVHAALFEYRSRRLNIKLFAVVVYFCLVDCYSCMKCKNVRDWNDREDENSKHIRLTSSLRNWNRWQRSLTCHGMEVVVFNSHAFIIVYMHGVRWQWKIETKIVQPLFSVTQAI